MTVIIISNSTERGVGGVSGSIYGDFLWAVLMLLHMVVPILLIVLAVILGAGLWGKIGNRGGLREGKPEPAITRGYVGEDNAREQFSSTKEDLSRV